MEQPGTEWEREAWRWTKHPTDHLSLLPFTWELKTTTTTTNWWMKQKCLSLLICCCCCCWKYLLIVPLEYSRWIRDSADYQWNFSMVVINHPWVVTGYWLFPFSDNISLVFTRPPPIYLSYIFVKLSYFPTTIRNILRRFFIHSSLLLVLLFPLLILLPCWDTHWKNPMMVSLSFGAGECGKFPMILTATAKYYKLTFKSNVYWLVPCERVSPWNGADSDSHLTRSRWFSMTNMRVPCECTAASHSRSTKT